MKPTYDFHPLADLFPLMEGTELDALAADIKANGLHKCIALYKGKIIDGRNRYRALQRLGFEPDESYFLEAHRAGSQSALRDDDEARAYVISKNIHRRHLTPEQKRDLLVELVKASPDKSNRQIAKTAKVDHKTVGAARAKLEGRGEIPHVETRTDTKGRKQPAKKKTGGAKRSAEDFGPRGEALPTRVMVSDGAGGFRRASSEEEETTFAVANAVANPIIDVWEKADEDNRSEFVRLYWTDLERIHAQFDTDHPQASADQRKALMHKRDDGLDIPASLKRVAP
jgi:ParB-like chromosome segregation protein Spo0J